MAVMSKTPIDARITLRKGTCRLCRKLPSMISDAAHRLPNTAERSQTGGRWDEYIRGSRLMKDDLKKGLFKDQLFEVAFDMRGIEQLQAKMAVFIYVGNGSLDRFIIVKIIRRNPVSIEVLDILR
jgi:hypothetical protein